MEIRDGLCGICPAGCWVRTYLRDGHLEKVEPFPDHPMGILCEIGRHSPGIVYDPDRLKTPLRRTGPKGTYQFSPVSWDEAMEEIAERLLAIREKFGPEAAAIYTGRGSFDMALCDIFQPAGVPVSSASSVLFPFGSPNTLGVGALCYVSFAMIAPHTTFGEYYITMDNDIEQSDLIVIWGANPATDSPPLAHERILRARERGAEIIAIDPYRNYTAKETQAEWLPIRPGTDGALALGMLQVIIAEELYDEKFVRDWTVGFDELARLCWHYRPEIVEGITGVPANTVENLARRLAMARGACPVMYTGLEYSDSGVQAIRAVFTLWGITGQLDVPGGLTIRMRENQFPQNRFRLLANPAPEKALGRDNFPLYTSYRGESHAISLPKSVLDGDPYKVRSLLILGGSIVTSWPDPELWKRTLKELDFLVSIDRYHTADSAYADLVLPATTGYEITSFMRYGPLFKIREKIIPPVGEARNDYLIMAELADRLGYGHLFPQSEEDVLRHALEGTDYTPESVRAAGGAVQIDGVMMQYKKWEKGLLREDGLPGFRTPSGKFEIASSILEEFGYNPLPVYSEPSEGPINDPATARKYPLVFNSGTRTIFDFRSQHHGVAGLRDGNPVPTVAVNPEDASLRNINDGDWVWVETPRGRVKYLARLTANITSGTIEASMGGGGPNGPRAWQDCNVNELTDPEHYDPISGFPIYKTLLCDVKRAEAGDGSPVKRKDKPFTGREGEKSSAPVKSRHVYLDYNATTDLDSDVLEEMLPYLQEDFGNPSSIHAYGNKAHSAVEDARRKIAGILGCAARRIIFTGSGSEANNLALYGISGAMRKKGRHIITTTIEHPAILAPCRTLEENGYEITYLPVNSQGLVNPRDLAASIRPDTILVSIMMANNETGAIQPIRELASITGKEKKIVFHTDAVQALGKMPFKVEDLGVDLLSLSSHKIHGPKGIGALYLRKDVDLVPLIRGGGQERGLRAGTENVSGIVGFGKACELAKNRLFNGEMEKIASLRDKLEDGIIRLLPGAFRNGPRKSRLANTLNLTIPEVRGESLVFFLDRRGIYFSSGSACKSGNPEPSHALLAMNLSPDQAHCSVRMSLGHSTKMGDINYTLDCLEDTLKNSSSEIRFAACR